MNRSIKFRAKGKSDGQWHYGSLLQMGNDYSIATNKEDAFEMCVVESETIGQFTGLLDCNGKEIYEDDIARIDTYLKCRVIFERGAFCYLAQWCTIPLSNSNLHYNAADSYDKVEVIGNIHDNPELMKVGEQ